MALGWGLWEAPARFFWVIDLAFAKSVVLQVGLAVRVFDLAEPWTRRGLHLFRRIRITKHAMIEPLLMI